MSDMAASLTAAFDRGVTSVDPDGYPEMDDQRFETLAAEMNRAVPWWTDSPSAGVESSWLASGGSFDEGADWRLVRRGRGG